jgi:ABC-type enterobactin transport system permease subunit
MEHRAIVLNVRLPRILLAIIVGAALSVAGAAYQALLRNRWRTRSCSAFRAARPWARCFRFWWPRCWRRWRLSSARWDDAAVYFLGQRRAELAPYTLLLAGIVVASFLSGSSFFSCTGFRGATCAGLSSG